ncbi:terminase large subunit [Asticcacaulis sp. ZE23SCel15]|uniref:terminase large subunit n=1 Tax=Asticcacaulis sp. ZE23SCel15 TaxID=3059027 RepID=UPI00265E02C2|nr:terminase large subunit [Asticcacaulis sp. ZE23SCel15]WKL57249.1 terminase large subunit [Asticcacaulis sp. ZE23SCel15]
MQWSTACLDWRVRIVERRSLIPSPLFADEGEEALKVFKSLRIVDAPDSPTFGEACEPWVFDFVRAIFGAYNAETGERLIREFFLLISKKNSKSTIAAGIMITALVRNWRRSAELLILAPTLEVANNAFNPARDMVRIDPDLSALMHVSEHTKTIKHRITDAELKVVAADSGTVTGKKASFVLVDELWIFGQRPDADAMLREATGGLVSRPEGFVVWLSTQADKPPTGVFKSKLSYARDVRDGVVVDTSFLPVLYEFPEDMIAAEDYLKPEFFYITNPNIGRSVSINWLISEMVKVQRGDASELLVFLSKHLNVEIGLRLRNDRWRGADYWNNGADTTLTLDELIARSEVVTVGIDGGGLDDLIGVSFIGREKQTRRWLCWSCAIANPQVTSVRKDIATELEGFAKEGSLIFLVVPEDVTYLISLIERVKAAGLLPDKNAVGIDPNNIAAIIEALIGIGITEDQISRLRQGPALAPAMYGLERKLTDSTLSHDGSALMVWVVGNAKVEMRGNSGMITKQVSGRAKIDPLIALFCAAILMSWNPEVKNAPEYQMLFF